MYRGKEKKTVTLEFSLWKKIILIFSSIIKLNFNIILESNLLSLHLQIFSRFKKQYVTLNLWSCYKTTKTSRDERQSVIFCAPLLLLIYLDGK